METGIPVFNDKIQFYMKADDTDDTLHHVTEDSAFDATDDETTYDPTYKDRVVQPSYVVGKKKGYDYDIDHVDGQTLQEFLYSIEDSQNVPTALLRVDIFKPKGDGFAAKLASASINPKALDGPSGAPIHHTGSIKLLSEWKTGTAVLSEDGATATFTPDEEA